MTGLVAAQGKSTAPRRHPGGERTRHDIVGLNYYDPYLADDRDDAQESSFALQTAGVIQGRDYLSGHIYDHHRIPVAKST
jgi:hypothetical protein